MSKNTPHPYIGTSPVVIPNVRLLQAINRTFVEVKAALLRKHASQKHQLLERAVHIEQRYSQRKSEVNEKQKLLLEKYKVNMTYISYLKTNIQNTKSLKTPQRTNEPINSLVNTNQSLGSLKLHGDVYSSHSTPIVNPINLNLQFPNPLLQNYICKSCGFTFLHAMEFEYHVKMHHILKIEDRNPYPCKQCDSSFSLVKELQDHMKVHKVSKSYNCDKCDFVSSKRSDLRLHSRMHCDKCDFVGSNLKDLKLHIKTNHREAKPHKCKQCELTFFTRRRLRTHKKVHAYKHNCEQCEAKFSTAASLDKHMRKHTNEKPYKCTQCDYTADS